MNGVKKAPYPWTLRNSNWNKHHQYFYRASAAGRLKKNNLGIWLSGMEFGGGQMWRAWKLFIRQVNVVLPGWRLAFSA
jgi:hypothetical protein